MGRQRLSEGGQEDGQSDVDVRLSGGPRGLLGGGQKNAKVEVLTREILLEHAKRQARRWRCDHRRKWICFP